jgi:hypothetical protein
MQSPIGEYVPQSWIMSSMSTIDSPGHGNLHTALTNAAELLAHDPGLAAEQAREILKIYPDTQEAKRILASAYLQLRMPKKGLDLLEPLLATHTDSPGFLLQYAQCLGGVARGKEAIDGPPAGGCRRRGGQPRGIPKAF